MRAFVTMTSAALLSVLAFGQSTPAQQTFEVADVHKSARMTSTVMRTALRGGRYELANATMVDLVRTAYALDPENVYGGPNWVEFDRFDHAGHYHRRHVHLSIQDALVAWAGEATARRASWLVLRW